MMMLMILAVAQALQLPNTNYAGRGYNLMLAEPLPRTAQDIAVPLKSSVIQLNFIDTVETNGVAYSIPAETEVVTIPSGTFGSEVSEISSVSDISNVVEHTFSLSLDYAPSKFGFSASGSVKSLVNAVTVEKSSVFIGTTMASTWKVDLKPYGDFKLSNSFVSGVKSLSLNESHVSYDRFVKSYGTHYITAMLMGGVATQTATLSNVNRKSLESMSVDVSEQAKISFYVDAQQSYAIKYNQAQQSNYSAMTKKDSYTTLGGDPKYNVLNYEKWLATIPSNPVPLSFAMEPLTTLMISDYFPDDPDIDLKARNVEKKITSYLATSLYCAGSCANGGTCLPLNDMWIGRCVCANGWTGNNCEVNVSPVVQQYDCQTKVCDGKCLVNENGVYYSYMPPPGRILTAATIDIMPGVPMYMFTHCDPKLADAAIVERQTIKDVEFNGNAAICPEGMYLAGIYAEPDTKPYKGLLKCADGGKAFTVNQNACTWQMACPVYSYAAGFGNYNQVYCCQSRRPTLAELAAEYSSAQ